MKEYVLKNYNPQVLLENKELVSELYSEYGVVIFPNFFNGDELFQKYLDDLNWIFNEVISRYTDDLAPEDLGDKLVFLNSLNPVDGKIITNLGTQPNKFSSFNEIKFSPYVNSLLKEIYKGDSILSTPQAGDTLHFFPPGEEFFKYNLPPHQDYQYLMQSPEQITFYLGLSLHKNEAGGLRLWEKSHKLGILPTTRNEFGSFEVIESDFMLKDYQPFDYEWNVGDFGFFDSLISHSSIPNVSSNAGRIVQIFRFCNLNNSIAKSYDFKSCVYDRDGVLFSDIHPSKIAK